MGQFTDIISNFSNSLDNIPNHYYLGAAILFAVIFYFAVKR